MPATSEIQVILGADGAPVTVIVTVTGFSPLYADVSTVNAVPSSLSVDPFLCKLGVTSPARVVPMLSSRILEYWRVPPDVYET